MSTKEKKELTESFKLAYHNPFSGSLIFLVVGVFLVFGIYLFVPKNQPSNPDTQTQPIKSQCEEHGGIWNSNYLECENISKSACDKMEGNFNECASACRHQKDATVCIERCVAVCSWLDFGDLESKSGTSISLVCGGFANIQCPNGTSVNYREILQKKTAYAHHQ